MLHQIGGDKRNALLSTDQCLDGRHLALNFSASVSMFVFDKRLNLRVDTGLLFVVQLDPGQAALVVDRNGCTVFDRAGNVIRCLCSCRRSLACSDPLLPQEFP